MRMDNTRCTAGLVFLGSRPLDLRFLAGRLERVLGARGFGVEDTQVMAADHLKMGLKDFELHMHTQQSEDTQEQSDGMQTMDIALSDARQPHTPAEIDLSTPTLTLTVTIVKRPADMPSLREAERSTVTAHSALALATLELAQVLDPDFVQWLQPDMMLKTSSFLSVLEKVTPRRVSTGDLDNRSPAERRKRPSPVLPFAKNQANRVSSLFPDIDDTCERLESHTRLATSPALSGAKDETSNQRYLTAVFKHEDQDIPEAEDAVETEALITEPSTTSRLATWAVSLVVSLISLPVGIALMVYNLIRGEDLRLALTALALTGLFVGLAQMGLTEEAIATLSGIPVVGASLSQVFF